MSWVKDTVSLGAIEQELKRRTGTKYPWGEYKSEPKRDACQCSPCQQERARLLEQAKKREQDLNCPQRMAKEPEQHRLSSRGYYGYQSMFMEAMGCVSSRSDDIWDEVVKEADSPRALQSGPKPTTPEEKKAAFRAWDMGAGPVFAEEIYMNAMTNAFIKSEAEKPKKTARTPLNTIKAPPGQRQPNKKKRNR